jgi:hypothetical protein
MKIKILLLVLFTATRALGQYNVVLSNETYANLTSGTELTYDATQAGYNHAIPFTFRAFQRTGDFSAQPSVPSNGAYITPKGYIAVYEKPGYANTIIFQGFYNTKLNYLAGITKVSMKLEGTAPNRVAKVEWKDMAYDNDANQKVSIQAWLHEVSGSVAYHFGPNNISTPSSLSSYTGIVVFDPTFTSLLNQFNIQGAYTALQTSTGNTTLSFPGMTGIPATGTVLTFNRVATTGILVQPENSVALYPNPAKNVVTIHLTDRKPAKISLVNISGQAVYSTTTTIYPFSLSLTPYKPGIYHIVAKTEEGNSYYQTLVVQGQ